MDGLNTLWEIFIRFLWPLVLLYAAYLHRELSEAMTKIERLQTIIFEHKAEVHKTFVTQEHVGTLENKLTRMLERIDDKITRILEDKK
jgi:hypothetical protein